MEGRRNRARLRPPPRKKRRRGEGGGVGLRVRHRGERASSSRSLVDEIFAACCAVISIHACAARRGSSVLRSWPRMMLCSSPLSFDTAPPFAAPAARGGGTHTREVCGVRGARDTHTTHTHTYIKKLMLCGTVRGRPSSLNVRFFFCFFFMRSRKFLSRTPQAARPPRECHCQTLKDMSCETDSLPE